MEAKRGLERESLPALHHSQTPSIESEHVAPPGHRVYSYVAEWIIWSMTMVILFHSLPLPHFPIPSRPSCCCHRPLAQRHSLLWTFNPYLKQHGTLLRSLEGILGAIRIRPSKLTT